jgi:molybdenum cofactor cytidylyltransferase
MKLTAVILAAGESSRMGRPKALLEVAGETFLGRLARVFREAGVGEVVVVLGHGADGLRAAAPAGARVVVNEAWREGMLGSVAAGAAAATGEAFFVAPVDHPLFRPSTVRALEVALIDPRIAVAVPTHEGRRGHPLLLRTPLRAELAQVPPGQGASWVMRRDPSRVAEVAVEDPGVVADVDTPEDYRRLVAGGG